ncbi:hypothetical protein VB712_19410 [Spirulina sp. CCNP1310]|uniref:hypothetical protein n=1 Tax=Spirulina sp. CCNP1310 TaxID=3110249 RepID=UPI002B1F6BD4|nr:hypothetical protein [Spirulina sp. CCNP1310]MEA5421399.1 hypothetical protein [Spirulina sp. CCNP1310]
MPDDSPLDIKIERLHRLTVYGRWLAVGVAWLVLAPPALWAMREQISLLREYFTWAGLRYGLAFHPWSAIALAFCIGFTTSVLVWQSRNILFGLPQRERQRLIHQLMAIERQGEKHPLARWFPPE